MKITKEMLLQLLENDGGATSAYPFIELGQLAKLNELFDEGLVVQIPRQDDLDEIRITDKGRAFLNSGVLRRRS